MQSDEASKCRCVIVQCKGVVVYVGMSFMFYLLKCHVVHQNTFYCTDQVFKL